MPTNTTAHEDRVLNDAEHIVTGKIQSLIEVVTRLDGVIDEKDKEIEALKDKAKDLEGEIEELKSQISSMNDEIKSHGG
jgi:peptidoglycan hydrolase CwlO-like protein